MGRADFQGCRWGLTFRPLGSDKAVFALNSDQLFIPGSTYKIFPGATVFSAFGAGHRFRTRIFRTGPIIKGVVKGDLIVVASGDLLMGGRIQRDGSLALPDLDHTFSEGNPLPGDPLRTLKDLARRVKARGVRRVEGRIRVDASLFREGEEDLFDNGIHIPVTPMMLNDNVVDVTVTPGPRAGATAGLRLSPDVGYVRITNEVVTVAEGATARPLRFVDDVAAADGTRRVRLTGDIPVTTRQRFVPYHVRGPARFAEMAFAMALADAGITAEAGRSRPGKARHLLAEYVSPPMSEQVKPMLKVSSNVHTLHFPYLTGGIAEGDTEHPERRGEQLQAELLRKAGLRGDLPDQARGLYTPDFFVAFLEYVSRRRYFSPFVHALPILGRDGSLQEVQPDASAAGHVFAKTGTAGTMNPATGKPVLSKGLAGYIRLPGGRWLGFAEFVEKPEAPFTWQYAAGDVLGEIAAVVYEELS